MINDWLKITSLALLECILLEIPCRIEKGWCLKVNNESRLALSQATLLILTQAPILCVAHRTYFITTWPLTSASLRVNGVGEKVRHWWQDSPDLFGWQQHLPDQHTQCILHKICVPLWNNNILRPFGEQRTFVSATHCCLQSVTDPSCPPAPVSCNLWAATTNYWVIM